MARRRLQTFPYRRKKQPKKIARPVEDEVERRLHEQDWYRLQSGNAIELHTMHRRVMYWDEQYLMQSRGIVAIRDKYAWIAVRCATSAADVELLLNAAEYILLLREACSLDISRAYTAYAPSRTEEQNARVVERMAA